MRTDTVIAFPAGCAYRRRLQAWLTAGAVTPTKILELSSYHAILACVAAGTGIAVVPKSVLKTMRTAGSFAVYPLAGKAGRATISLIWRKGEGSQALRALQEALSQGKAARRNGGGCPRQRPESSE